MVTSDYVVVGAGLTGATIARVLADAGREVMIVDRRHHFGGNVHDQRHESGIWFNTYGPHYFRTASSRIWDFVNRFMPFRPFEASLLSFVDNSYIRWPIHASDICRLAGDDWVPAFSGEAHNFEEAALSIMPEIIYRRFVKSYTEKQWGVPAASLSALLARRFEIRLDGDSRLSRFKYQGIPSGGYSAWVEKMLSGIPISLGIDYMVQQHSIRHRQLLIFTGPIDEFYGFSHGRLRYRGQRRIHTYFPDSFQKQPGIQVNYPSLSDGQKVRTLEWKYLMSCEERKGISGTLTTDEIPIEAVDPNDFEYPFPDEKNQLLYRTYASMAYERKDILICGRLGEYRYLDMDQAIARALNLARKIVKM